MAAWLWRGGADNAVNEEQKYLFDLRGYLVIENALTQETVGELNQAAERIEDIEPSAYPPPVERGKEMTDEELYLSNILEGDPAFLPLIDLPGIVDIVESVTPGAFRLNHTYMVSRKRGGYTYLHMGGTPIHPKAMYFVAGGEIVSTLTKVVFPLLGTEPDDGCFAVIPGSHKSSFVRPWGPHPDENPPLEPVRARPGDAIIFTEALAHGSLVNHSGRARRTVFFCYSVGYMPDWGRFGLHFSEGLSARLSELQREIVRLK